MVDSQKDYLTFQDIHKHYGEKIVLNAISAEIAHGKITSLIGPNGAGKSTLLAILSRLLKQDGGKVSFFDKNIGSYKGQDLAKKLAILRQSNHLDLKLTVEDLVSFGRFPYSQGRLSSEDKEAVQNAIRFTELESLADAYLDELSGGQRQRAFISMIIAQDTDYILLDEPLNNLDMKHSVHVMKTLRRLVDELGKTVILVIHEINFAAQYSDFIIALKNGEIVQHDKTNQIIQSNVLRDIFEIDFDIIDRNDKLICNYFNL
ncbi:ABC transporter ATP-binding protein [Sphingobacterium humi]|uniref:ATP-binding cassette domain-containing protein n=1 Tax=Sphingobacterium humi TaxID=1796905 RepID=A0A6N8KV40_9SPHI|nr:ATP-binding cassette domain-containing protein [Sphingobacterium humi]MVZ60654.1 ATP-binding cassette domain-containing protein [Sphingobacterium humi]